MSLNPEKCVFGVKARKFLGFLISSRGIDVNPGKVKVVLAMSPPRNMVKYRHPVRAQLAPLTQRFKGGAVNYLSRFCSKLVEKSLPFFNVFHKPEAFEWTEACEQAFLDLKSHLAKLSTLTLPVAWEELQMYISVGPTAVSAILTQQEEIRVYFSIERSYPQRPVTRWWRR
ncbi:hypothetical protein V2J09_013083 [Rumex salicifolius]